MRISLSSHLIEYDEFLKNNLCTFYQSEKYLNFLERLLRIKTEFIIATENKKMIGVLSFFRKKTKFGIVLNSLPFLVATVELFQKILKLKKI